MDAQNVFVGDQEVISITCPNCLNVKSIPVKALRDKYQVKARCACEVVFKVKLEFRKKFRKPIDLPGSFTIAGEMPTDNENIVWDSVMDHHDYQVRIKNISTHGIGMAILERHSIQKGHVLRVKFALDNSANTIINKRAIVRGVREKYIGCEFIESDKDDQTIGFYVL